MASSGGSPSWYHRFLTLEKDEASELYPILADERRRALLDVLDKSDKPVTVAELARLVASHASGNAPDEVPSAVKGDVQIALQHNHLPKLEAHNLIVRADEESIARNQHPFWTTSELRTFLPPPDVAPATTTATLDLLTNRQRRAVLAILLEHRNTTVGELAEALVNTPVAGQERSRVVVELTHRHLPKLEAANVIEFDTTEDRVRYMGNAVLERWLARIGDGGEASLKSSFP